MNDFWHCCSCEKAAVAEASVWCFLSRIALHGVSVLLHYSRKGVMPADTYYCEMMHCSRL